MDFRQENHLKDEETFRDLKCTGPIFLMVQFMDMR